MRHLLWKNQAELKRQYAFYRGQLEVLKDVNQRNTNDYYRMVDSDNFAARFRSTQLKTACTQ